MLVFFYVVQITYANVNICILCKSYHAFHNKLCNIMVSPQLYLVYPCTHPILNCVLFGTPYYSYCTKLCYIRGDVCVCGVWGKEGGGPLVEDSAK